MGGDTLADIGQARGIAGDEGETATGGGPTGGRGGGKLSVKINIQ